jgi:hypothetical protein
MLHTAESELMKLKKNKSPELEIVTMVNKIEKIKSEIFVIESHIQDVEEILNL